MAGLAPRSLATQNVRDHQLYCTPEPTHRAQFDDAYGNHLSYLALSAPHDTLNLVAMSWVEIEPPAPAPDAGLDVGGDRGRDGGRPVGRRYRSA